MKTVATTVHKTINTKRIIAELQRLSVRKLKYKSVAPESERFLAFFESDTHEAIEKRGSNLVKEGMSVHI